MAKMEVDEPHPNLKTEEKKKKKKKKKKMKVDEPHPILKTEEKKKKKMKMKVEEREQNPDTEDEDEENKSNKKKREKKKKDTVHVKIETLSENPNKISPFVGYFPSGYDPLKLGPETPESESPPQHRVRVFRDVKKTKRLQLVVTPNGSKVDFVGINYEGEAAAAQVCTYALGVLDKQTQTLKVVPIASNKIFRLEPKIRSSGLSENEPSNLLTEEPTAEQKTDKRRELTLVYGTKRSRNQDMKRQSLHPQEHLGVKEDSESKLEEIKPSKEAFDSADAYNARNIPPHDISATTPETAYPLDKIIFKGEWDYLLDILKGSDIRADVYPSFVCNRIHRLDNIEDEVEQKKLACILSYIAHLIKFKDKHSMEGVSSAKHHKFPSILSQKFSNMFGESELRRLSNEKSDLLISYVLVLSLFVDDFRSDPTDITKDLRMSVVAVRPYYEHLGCKFVRTGTISWATLPTPLRFPKIRGKRRR
ncbi:uncharacterized protein LOC132282888 [Cornus florida]|uniref:uncharacterized protein LOC132282888 n=1 Tax=Cornus florida TaxID=4283 RepID=UPI0028A138C4|nr:uncharacterized protein LOC132282888 [Cornus florida]